MSKCTEWGCRNLQTTCLDCERVVCTKNLSPAQRWTSVTLALPEKRQPVLFCTKEEMFVGRYNGNNEWEIGCVPSTAYPCKDHVTDWAPRPDRPLQEDRKCKLVQFNDFGKLTYTCDEVRERFKRWKHEFMEYNRCDENDRMYKRFIEEIEEFLGRCRCTM
jgi:hypothetical protein